MARAIELDSETIVQIIGQVKESLPVGLVAFVDSLTLGQTFDVWRLAKLADGLDLTTAAVPAHSYHHQLFANGKPVGFVRSELSPDGESREVTQVTKSRLAERVDEAVNSVNAVEKTDEPARLLAAAPEHLFAFWFPATSGNRCYVITCPGTFVYLKPGDHINGRELLTRLSKETAIVGAEPPPRKIGAISGKEVGKRRPKRSKSRKPSTTSRVARRARKRRRR